MEVNDLFFSMAILNTSQMVDFFFSFEWQTRKLKTLLEQTLGWDFHMNSAVDAMHLEEDDEVWKKSDTGSLFFPSYFLLFLLIRFFDFYSLLQWWRF